MAKLKHTTAGNILILTAGLAATAALLLPIQPPLNIAPLAWIALIPFILVCSRQPKTSHLLITTYIIGAAYWLTALHWVGPVTAIGWIVFCLYTAFLWPLIALGVRFAISKNIPLILAVPLIFVGAEQFQGFLLGGFLWRLLGHSQYANIELIQIADIFGASGVSFLVAMVNGLFAQLLLSAYNKKILTKPNIIQTALTAAAVIATLTYGAWRISQHDQYVSQGPVVASVQSNVPQAVKESWQVSDEIFISLLSQTRNIQNSNARLVVWPETMVQTFLDPRISRYLESQGREIPEKKILQQHAQEHDRYMLVGAYGGTIGFDENNIPYYAEKLNSAFLYTPEGIQSPLQYSKIHLVPFGEVLPFVQTLPWLENFLMTFTPYDYDYTLDPGTEFTIFPITTADGQKEYKFGVIICYEDVVPEIAQEFALDKDGNKQVDWLVNISNDGWFVRYDGKNMRPSAELPQHVAVCVFRAVENRLAVVRSVNTGISCLIDTYGRVRDGYISGNLPTKAMSRQAVEGWFADTVPIDNRVTIFTRYGRWLDYLCGAGFIAMAIGPGVVSWSKRRKISKNHSKRKDPK